MTVGKWGQVITHSASKSSISNRLSGKWSRHFSLFLQRGVYKCDKFIVRAWIHLVFFCLFGFLCFFLEVYSGCMCNYGLNYRKVIMFGLSLTFSILLYWVKVFWLPLATSSSDMMLSTQLSVNKVTYWFTFIFHVPQLKSSNISFPKDEWNTHYAYSLTFSTLGMPNRSNMNLCCTHALITPNHRFCFILT